MKYGIFGDSYIAEYTVVMSLAFFVVKFYRYKFLLYKNTETNTR